MAHGGGFAVAVISRAHWNLVAWREKCSQPLANIANISFKDWLRQAYKVVSLKPSQESTNTVSWKISTSTLEENPGDSYKELF